jgi:predicted glycoside hydrolase/deacetylase ChbG (UPF0249 family)
MKIIINADDFGMEEAVDDGITQLFEKGLLDRTSLMVNMPDTGRAVRLAGEYGYLHKVGLHINLTEGEPLTRNIKGSLFCDDSGILQNRLGYKERIYLNPKYRKIAKEEIEAQMERFFGYGLTLRHADSHNYTSADWNLEKTVLECCKTYGFTSLRLAKNIHYTDNKGFKLLYRYIANIGIKKFNREYSTDQCSDYFGTIPQVQKLLKCNPDFPGTVELMVHPFLKSDGRIVDHYTHMELTEPLRNFRREE